MRDDRVIDLFAGPGGWDEGVRALGLRPFGIEWDASACKTAMAAGHARLQDDIATLDPRDVAARYFDGPIRGLIASPPCQGFSQAGKQKGRLDAHLLLAAIPEMTKRDVRPELHDQMADSRSVLVLEPLRWALALTPSWMAWEQVPAVLPIWEKCAEVLRSLGYTVATGNLQSETFGVPQTRKRAILVARAPWMTAAMGPAELPEPTHSRYHSRNPGKLDEGVLPWVSMAEALGWGMTARPYPTIAGGTGGGPDPLGVGGSHARGVITDAHEAGGDAWIQQSNYSAPPKFAGQTAAERGLAERPMGEPSYAVTSKGFRWLRHNQGDSSRPRSEETGKRHVAMPDGSDYYMRFPTEGPAPTLTTQVDAWKWDDAERVEDDGQGGKRYYVGGTGANATVRDETQPAPTVHFGERVNTVEWQRRNSGPGAERTPRSVDEPSYTVRAQGSGSHPSGVEWVVSTGTNTDARPKSERDYSEGWEQHTTPYERPVDAPAPTVVARASGWQVHPAGERAAMASGTRENASVRSTDEPSVTLALGHDAASYAFVPEGTAPTDVPKAKRDGTAVRVTIAEAAVLQSFPADYPWQGTKTAQYRQVGDAVPPGLALAVVSKVSGIPVAKPDGGPWPFRKPAPTLLGANHGVLPKPGQTHHEAHRELAAEKAAGEVWLTPANGRARTDGGGAWPRSSDLPAPTVTGEVGGQWRWRDTDPREDGEPEGEGAA